MGMMVSRCSGRNSMASLSRTSTTLRRGCWCVLYYANPHFDAKWICKKKHFWYWTSRFWRDMFFFAIPISYLFYATQHAPGGKKLWKFAARVSSRLQHWLEICNSVWVKLVDCHGLHKATDPCNFRYVLRVISMYLSSDQFWANSFDPY